MKKLIALILAGVLSVSLVACSSETTEESTTTEATTTEATTEETTTEETTVDYSGLTMGKADYAAHGTKAFAATTVVLAGDTIVATYIDEYQYLSTDYIGVPNSDAGFGEAMLANEQVLASKRANMEAYSANMTEKAGSTQALDVSWGAVEEFCVGKTISELEEWASTAEGADVVAGSTLVDTVGYVQSVIAAAKNAPTSTADPANFTDIKIGKADYAAHGTKCFTLASAAVIDDVVVAAYVDEYQYLSTDYIGVPNSDAGFGEAMLANDQILGSKRVNMEAYSANMAEKAGSTQALDVSWSAVEEFCVGKTITELEEWASTAEGADVIAGSTLVDTVGYVNSIIEAAKVAS